MDKNNLNNIFQSFLAEYNENEKDRVWEQQSKFFRDFWNDKILNSKAKDLNDFEIDEVIQIMDKHGKGNTKESNAIARVMIPQGAWRRMFNQLNENRTLSSTLNKIISSNDSEERSRYIDELFLINSGNKNHLTGKSGSAINCFLAVSNPFKHLSIVSLKHRLKILEYFNIECQLEKMTIGEQIEESSKLILNLFKNRGINNNARTISAFVYSDIFKEYWKGSTDKESIEESDETIEINVEKSSESEYLFVMEKALEDFIIGNWDKTELGKRFDLIMDLDEGVLKSQQFKTDIGVIDILVKDKKSDQYVVIELKRNQTSDDTVGQLMRYMGWVDEHLSKEKPSKGIIIAAKYDKKLSYAIKRANDVEVFIYKLNFNLEEYQ